MKQSILLGVLIILISVIWVRTKNGNSRTIKISAEKAKQRLNNERGIILLDVRTPQEYRRKHIPNSILIPVTVLADEAVNKIPDKNTEIIVYCRTGNRSASAVKILTDLGYTNIHDLGGINGWPYKTVSAQ